MRALVLTVIVGVFLLTVPTSAADEVGIWVCTMYDEDRQRNADGEFDHHDNIGVSAHTDGGPPNPTIDGPDAAEIQGGAAILAADVADGDTDGNGQFNEGGGFAHASLTEDDAETAGAGTDTVPLFAPQRSCPFS